MSTADERQYKPPRIEERAFNCPHCDAFAHQHKYHVYVKLMANDENIMRKMIREMSRNKKNPFIYNDIHILESQNMGGVYFFRCSSCNGLSIWIFNEMIWPPESGVPRPNSDLPDDVRRDYEEAGTILGSSPRGAAALLRLGIQKLCKYLGESGNDLNKDISELVKKGLSPQVQKALDSIRVIGNNAVHPGQIDLQDDQKTARSLFDLVNLIADLTISNPKRVSQIFENLPEGAKQAIEKRDAK